MKAQKIPFFTYKENREGLWSCVYDWSSEGGIKKRNFHSQREEKKLKIK